MANSTRRPSPEDIGVNNKCLANETLANSKKNQKVLWKYLQHILLNSGKKVQNNSDLYFLLWKNVVVGNQILTFAFLL